MSPTCIQYSGVFWALFAVIRSGKSLTLANRMAFFLNLPGKRPGRDTITMDMAILIVACYEECLIRSIVIGGLLARMATRDPFIADSIQRHYSESKSRTGLEQRVPDVVLERLASAETVESILSAIRRILFYLGHGEKARKAQTVAVKRLIARSLAASAVEQVAPGMNKDWIPVSARCRKRGPFTPRKPKKPADG